MSTTTPDPDREFLRERIAELETRENEQLAVRISVRARMGLLDEEGK